MLRRSSELLLVAALTSATAVGQAQLEWYESFNSAVTGGYPSYSADYAGAATRDAAGNLYLAGWVDWTASQPNYHDPLTLKYDAAGSLVWSHRYAGMAGYERAGTIAVDASGNVYVGVTDYGASIGTETDENVVLLKYAANGTFEWASAPYDAGGKDRITAPQCVIDAAGNVYLGITSSGPTPDIVLLSYDPSGALRFDLRFDGPAGLADEAKGLAIDAAGDLLLFGGADAPFTNIYNTQSWLAAKVTTGGSVVWSSFTPGIGGVYPQGFALDPSGDLYLAIRGDEAVVKLDPSGGVAWSTPVAGLMNDVKAIALDASGAVAVVGTQGFGMAMDVAVAYLDRAGSVVWTTTWNGPGNREDDAVAVAIDAAGEVSVLGRTVASVPNLQTDANFVVWRYTPGGVLRWTYADNFGWSHAGPLALFLDAGGDVLVAGSISKHVSSQPLTFQTDTLLMSLGEPVQPICAGDGSYGACPCGNTSASGAGRGCANSIGQSAKLAKSGVASAGADSLVLTSSGELATSLSIALQGSVVTPTAFGDGLRCVGGNLKRLFVRNAIGGVVSVPAAGDPSISARSAALGDPLSGGSVRAYQVYYRDPDAGFCQAPQGSTWNVSSGLRITWSH